MGDADLLIGSIPAALVMAKLPYNEHPLVEDR